MLSAMMTMGMVCAGLAMGALAAFWSKRFAASVFEGLPLDNPLPILFACAAMIAIALVASYIPAHRAGRVEPMDQARVRLIQPDAEWRDRKFRAVDGQNIVLYLSEFGGIPIPDAMGGYELLIETNADLLRPGVILRVPSNEVRVYLNQSSTRVETSDAFSGLVEVLDFDGSAVTASLDLRNEERRWQRHETVRFRPVALRFYSMSDWGVWMEGGGSWLSYATAIGLAPIGVFGAGVMLGGRHPRIRSYARAIVQIEIALAVLVAFRKILGLAVLRKAACCPHCGGESNARTV